MTRCTRVRASAARSSAAYASVWLPHLLPPSLPLAAAPGMYTPTFPASFHRPASGGSATMVMFFSCLGGAPTCRYTLNWQVVTLALNASEV